MADMLNIMFVPFLACLMLIGIHAYFGIHVLKREVIFVDLALAQIASLGATVAFLFGIDPESVPAYFFSVGFITLAATIFALTRTRQQKISQEAIIGIVYAVATAAAILVADRSPHGAEHIKEMMTGTLLWVSGRTVGLDALIYALIGALHLAFYRQFMAISESSERAFASGLAVRFWDFLFYVSFGLVVSLSVRVAGVLLVFCFLIVPAVISLLFAERMWRRLGIGWAVGTFVSVLALLFSWAYDTPSGPTIACGFGLALIVAAGLRWMDAWLDRRAEALGTPSPRRLKVASVAVLCGVLFLSVFIPAVHHVPGSTGQAEDHHAPPGAAHAAMPDTPHETGAPDEADPHRAPTATELVAQLLQAEDDDVRSAAAEELVRRGDQTVVPHLVQALAEEQRFAVRFALARVLVGLGDPRGLGIWIEQLADTDWQTIKYRQEALDLLQSIAGESFGYDVLAEDNRAALKQWRNWWAASKGKIVWNPQARTFRLNDGS